MTWSLNDNNWSKIKNSNQHTSVLDESLDLSQYLTIDPINSKMSNPGSVTQLSQMGNIWALQKFSFLLLLSGV